MSLAYKKWTSPLALQGIALIVVALAGNLSLHAANPPEEDLSNNEVCLDCHMDEEQVGVLEVAGAQVHNPEDSTLIQEAHTEVACIDCHQDIQEVPHAELDQRTVDCLACHESIPE
jgi:nitrate/TMAO reductase-like tetraheme cytochrome c subunit